MHKTYNNFFTLFPNTAVVLTLYQWIRHMWVLNILTCFLVKYASHNMLRLGVFEYALVNNNLFVILKKLLIVFYTHFTLGT